LVEAFLRDLPIVPFDLAAARCHAALWAHLASEVGSHDLFIVATALAAGHEIATLNACDFARVPGVRLVPLEAYGALTPPAPE
jgi:predicted nucleic acid-binding protein